MLIVLVYKTFCFLGERSLKSEISSLLVEKSTLEARINTLISSRAGEKQTLTSLEKKLMEEKRQRAEFQLKLETERKNKKVNNCIDKCQNIQHPQSMHK